jgi:haloacetate dehalogenase
MLIQPAPIPETLLAGDTATFLRNFPFRGAIPSAIGEDVFAEYVRCFGQPETLHATCEDYRAAATIDLDHDRQDLQQRVQCPVLALWGERGAMHRLFDVLDTWRERTVAVYGKALPAGHWLPEECPAAVSAALLEFLA